MPARLLLALVAMAAEVAAPLPAQQSSDPDDSDGGEVAVQGEAVGEATVRCHDPSDCTVELQAALSDITLRRVIIPRGVQPWSTLPLVLNRSNFVLTFEAGAIVQARRGFFHDLYTPLLNVIGVSNVSIEGDTGASLRMWRSDYANASQYDHSEARHGIILKSCTGVSVIGLEIAETGGDGLYLIWVQNVVLRSLTTMGAFRNGLSVIGANDLLVENCSASQSSTWNYLRICIEMATFSTSVLFSI